MIDVLLCPFTFGKEDDHYRLEHEFGLQSLYAFLKEKKDFKESYTSFLDLLQKGDYGKPYLKGYEALQFNLSHCEGYLAIALSEKPIGIDIEKIRSVKEGVMKKVLTEKEFSSAIKDKEPMKAFCSYWTLKESYLKYRGEGFHFNPKMVEFEVEEENIICSDRRVYCLQKRIDKDTFLAFTSEEKIDFSFQTWPKQVLK